MSNLAKNQRAFYDYDIKQTFDAGLVLSGKEVKAAKQGNISLNGSFVSIQAEQAYLTNCHIGPYKYAPNEKYDPTQRRKLLLKKTEILQLIGKEKGLVLIPLEIYANSRGLVKVKVGLGKARKKLDKRDYLKKRDTDREIRKNTDH